MHDQGAASAVLAAASGAYVDDAIETLAATPVYVSPEVSGSGELGSVLLEQVGDESIGIAVFSENVLFEASGPEIVSELAGRYPGYDTIIVAVGDDLSAGSRVLDEGEAMRIANEAEGSAGSLEAALTETVQTVVEESAPAPVTSGGVPGGVVLALAVVGAAAVAGVIAAVAVVRRRSRSRGARDAPGRVRGQIQVLRSLSGEYAAVGARGNAVAAQLAPEIAGIADNVAQLFARLDKKGLEDQSGLAQVEYGDKLAKLTAAIDRDYLLDILTHPQLWDDPAERVAEVRGAVTAVSGELLENIKQVNARRGLYFQVSLDSLIGRRAELQDWEREFRRSEGGTDASPAVGS